MSERRANDSFEGFLWNKPSFSPIITSAKGRDMKPFLSEDFLLHTESAGTLYHDFAEKMPIFDYHCHLPVHEIAQNKNFENLEIEDRVGGTARIKR